MHQTDQFDPATLAAELPRRTPVLVSCDADAAIRCAQVAHLSGDRENRDHVTYV